MKTKNRLWSNALVLWAILGFCLTISCKQEKTYSVILDQVAHGHIVTEPEIVDSIRVAEGKPVKIKAVPAEGYAVDACYYSYPGIWGAMYAEHTSDPVYEPAITQDVHVGASFIKKSELEGFKVTHNVPYAKPGVKQLKYDVYSPDGAQNLPIIVIIHGGGWRSNTEDIMRGLARELVRDGKYVVCSIDYRWIDTLDGDATPNTLDDLISDVYGAIAHIQENAAKYGGDPTRIALTGDSAGGHLCAAAANMPNRIGDKGFGKVAGVYEYKPTYLPENKSIAQVRDEMVQAIKAVAPSYAVFMHQRMYEQARKIDSTHVADVESAISPIENIPNVEEREIPQLLLRGTEDGLIKNEMVESYYNALKEAGQKAVYIQVEGANHAFFDWKPDAVTKATFARYGVKYAKVMEEFFNEVFY